LQCDVVAARDAFNICRRHHVRDRYRSLLAWFLVRVVFLGKGGSGKSTLAGLLCAELTNRNEKVVAIDADTVPGVDQVLGMAPTDEWSLAGTAVRENGGWRLDGSPAEIVERCSREAPGGVRFLQIGNVDAGLKEFELRRERQFDRWSGMVAFNTVSRVFDEQDGWTVVDLQGGTVQVAGGLVGTAGTAILVVEPFAKSVLTARRFVEMGRWPKGIRLVGVANKVASAEDDAYVDAALSSLGVPLWVSVPKDPTIERAERNRQALVTVADETPAKQAVAKLADLLAEAHRAGEAVSTTSSSSFAGTQERSAE
jgi:CO dehydrogenase maturation factor